jgi:hypothetical protein
MKESGSEIIVYQTEDGQAKVQVRLEGGTVWLTQAAMADLYQTSRENITLHVGNIYEDKELPEKATCKEYLLVRIEGERQVQRPIKHYNLDMILAIGYRVRSHRGTQFRQWATARLREFLVKGFVLDDERLKEGRTLGADYFDELLERIRDIRSSERLFYQKITDIYAQCSADYDPRSSITQEFFATVQNKLHWAIHGRTAAELIAERADADKLHMGLTTWKNAPKGKIRKTDISIAKNYLNEYELRRLNRIVTMYLDYAEEQAERRHAMTMRDWVEKLDAFLKFNEKDILTNPGKVSAEVAHRLADTEFAKYEKKRLDWESQNPSSDFDKVVQKWLDERKNHHEEK